MDAHPTVLVASDRPAASLSISWQYSSSSCAVTHAQSHDSHMLCPTWAFI